MELPMLWSGSWLAQLLSAGVGVGREMGVAVAVVAVDEQIPASQQCRR